MVAIKNKKNAINTIAVKNACEGCDLCCRKYKIYLFPSEAKKIARFLGLNYKEFVSKYLDFYFDIMEVPDDLNNDEFILIDTDLTEKKSILFSALALKQNENCCMFLKDKLCTIYNARPLICRLFPKFKIFNAEYNFCKLDSREACEDKDRKKYYPILRKYLHEIKITGFKNTWKYIPEFNDKNIFVMQNGKQINLSEKNKLLKEFLERTTN